MSRKLNKTAQALLDSLTSSYSTVNLGDSQRKWDAMDRLRDEGLIEVTHAVHMPPGWYKIRRKSGSLKRNGSGKQLQQAVKIRETFMDRDHKSVRRMKWEWPKELVLVGSCEAIMYKSDKWQKDGREIDYKHVSEAPQKLYLRSDMNVFGPHKKVRLTGLPDSFAVLAKSLGVQAKVDGGYFQLQFPPGSMLGAGKFKNGKIFCFVFDKTGVLALVDGKDLDVLKDGIVG